MGDCEYNMICSNDVNTEYSHSMVLLLCIRHAKGPSVSVQFN